MSKAVPSTTLGAPRGRTAEGRDLAPGVAEEGADHLEASTRQRVLRLVVEDGPVSVVELAEDLHLTTAGVRRHVAALEDAGEICVHRSALPTDQGRRGRPARRYIATDRGKAGLGSSYPELAARALQYVAEVAGRGAVEQFAARRAAELVDRHADAVSGETVAERVEALAVALQGDGYASSARPVLDGRAVQLCQGHCPVQDVAAQFPQLCEAETQAFSRLLGVHVQRLSTLAAGGHVCTTHVPTTTSPVRAASDRPAPGTVEGTR